MIDTIKNDFGIDNNPYIETNSSSVRRGSANVDVPIISHVRAIFIKNGLDIQKAGA